MRKPSAALIIVSLLGVLLAHSAYAGPFSTALSDENAKDLKRLGISSSLGHKLQGQQVGLTVFGNRHFEADLPDWTLDAGVRRQLMEEIAASGRLTAALEPWEGAPTGARAFGPALIRIVRRCWNRRAMQHRETVRRPASRTG